MKEVFDLSEAWGRQTTLAQAKFRDLVSLDHSIFKSVCLLQLGLVKMAVLVSIRGRLAGRALGTKALVLGRLHGAKGLRAKYSVEPDSEGAFELVIEEVYDLRTSYGIRIKIREKIWRITLLLLFITLQFTPSILRQAHTSHTIR